MSIRIKSLRKNGHFRAGVFHASQDYFWPDDAFTQKQKAAMDKDPALEVEPGRDDPVTETPTEEAAAPDVAAAQKPAPKAKKGKK